MNNTLIFVTTGIADYLISASVITVVLVTIAWGGIKLFKIKSPVQHHMIWFFTLVAVLIVPIIWLFGPKIPMAVLPARMTVQVSPASRIDIRPVEGRSDNVFLFNQLSFPEGSSSQPATLLNSLHRPHVKSLISCLWLAGFIFMLIRLLIGSHQLANIVRSAETAPDIHFKDAGPGLLKILLTTRINCPVCCGLLRPTILLPKKMYDNNAPEDIRMALSHELAHIERKDVWVNMLQRIAEAILFFHPLLWYASFQLTHNRERICDHHVIAKGASPSSYVQLLTRMVEQGFRKNSLHTVALFEGRLLLRVRSLIEHGNKIRLKPSRREVSAGVLIILLCLAAGAIRLEARANSGQESMQIQSNHMEVSDEKAAGNGTADERLKPQIKIQGKSGTFPEGSCSISGKVVSAETGEPLVKATITMVFIETKASRRIETASDGSFEFKDISRGQYGLRAGKASGFQDACYAPEKNNGQSPFLSLSEGEKKTGVVLRLKPAYSISGRIMRENGMPFTGDRLGVLAWVESNKQDETLNRYEIVKQTLVRNDGSYALTGLDNRPVFLMVIDFDSDEKEQAWSRCSYPGAAPKEQAQMVYFNKGRYVDNVDIRQNQKGEFVLMGNGNNKI